MSKGTVLLYFAKPIKFPAKKFHTRPLRLNVNQKLPVNYTRPSTTLTKRRPGNEATPNPHPSLYYTVHSFTPTLYMLSG